MTPREYNLYWAARMADRATRFKRLTELEAPAFILANERKLLFEALMRIPVDVATLDLVDTTNQKGREEEVAFLRKHGFFEEDGS